MTIGAEILCYRQEIYLPYCLEAIYDWVDHIVVVYSENPWSRYNPRAATMPLPPDRSLEILRTFPDPARKMTIIEGAFDSEEATRTAGLEELKTRGMDYLFVVDADEIYHPSQLGNLKPILKRFPEIRSFWMPMHCFWKSFDFVLTRRAGYGMHGQFRIFRICPEQRFVFYAFPNFAKPSGEIAMRNLTCYHFGYVFPDAYIRHKARIMHADDTRNCEWYDTVWKCWYPGMRNLGIDDPEDWPAAIPFDKTTLPAIMKRHPYYTHPPVTGRNLLSTVLTR